ncbi:MAG: hypothetical protein ACE15B_16240 [Bryobacteraceae bacterium]
MRFLWILAALAVLYLGFVWHSRNAGDRQQVKTRPSKPPAASPGDGLRILQFYASQGEVASGGNVTICYGVENARAVSIDPPVSRISPAVNRCIEAAPRQTTTYTLTAEGEKGERVNSSFTVKVRPRAPYIVSVDLSEAEIARGGFLTMCYSVRDATGARLEPGGLALPASERHCLRLAPTRTTDYIFTASGPGGKDQEKFTITVR